MTQIKYFPEKIVPDDSDLILIQDATGVTKRISRVNFLSGISPTTPVITTYKFWRIRNTVTATGNGGQWIVRELSFLDSSFNNIAIGGSVIASLSNNNALAFDGSFNTFWGGAGQFVLNSWIGYQFPNDVKPDYLRLTNLNNGQIYNIPPTQYAIDKSSNGNDWLEHQTFTTDTSENIHQVTIT